MRHFKDKSYIFSLLTGAVLLAISFAINSYAVAFATKDTSSSVTDIVLSNIPVYNVDGFFVYGAVILVVVIAIVCFVKLHSAPFVLKSLALFTVIRSFFLSLTHIAPYPEHVAITPSIFTHLFPSIFTGSDLFFSGHTGMPFLLALIFWDNIYLRVMFLGFSIMFAIVVLLGHLHYSIDVASAFFITYTIFVMAKSFFRKDYLRLTEADS